MLWKMFFYCATDISLVDYLFNSLLYPYNYPKMLTMRHRFCCRFQALFCPSSPIVLEANVTLMLAETFPPTMGSQTVVHKEKMQTQDFCLSRLVG